jgi:hypothetical protein
VDKILDGPETWIGRAATIADAAALLFAGENEDVQRIALARVIATWCGQFPPVALDNIVDPDIETRDAAMGRLLSELHRAEARLAREKWLKSAQ